MKTLILITMMAFGMSVSKAQILHPVKWSYAAKKINEKEAVLFFKAEIDDNWHIYSTTQPDGGPVKTSFSFTPAKDVELIDNVIEPKPVTRYEKAFDMNVSYFEKSVIFQQKVKLNAAMAVIKGNLKFMVCNDRQCLPPETVSFSIPVK